MYCPQCGIKNPDDAKFCGSCGCPMLARGAGGRGQASPQVQAAPQAQQADSVEKSPRRASLPKKIALVAVVVVAVLGAAAFGITRLLDTGLPTGSVLFYGGTSYRFEREGLDTRLTVASTDTDGTTIDRMTGILRKDGENENGPIFRMSGVTDANGDASGYDTLEFRFQFPAGIADGELQGTWIMERMVKNDIGGFDPVRNDVSVYVADGSTQSASYDFSNGSEGSLIDNPRSIGQLEADAEQSDEYSVWSITSNSLATWNKTSDGSYQLVLPYYGGTLPIVFRLE